MAWWKSIGSIYLTVWIVQWLSFWVVKHNSSGYFRAHVIHLQRVVILELLMLLGSFFVWRRITALLLETAGQKHKDSECGDNRSRSTSKKLYGRLSTFGSSLEIKKTLRLAIYVFLVPFLFCAHFSQFLNYFANTTEPRMISLICFSCFGVLIHLVAFLVGFSFVNFLVRYASSKSIGKAILTPLFSRFAVIQHLLTNVKWQTTAAIVLSVFFSIFLLLSAGDPRLKKVEITLQKLPQSMDGLTIALLTDLHAGPTVGRNAFKEAVQITNVQRPDIVVIVGDLVDGTVDDLKSVVEPISRLGSKYGVYFSTGNHEMYYGKVDDWLAYLKTLNVKVLHNENVKIRAARQGANSDNDDPYLCLAGAADIIGAETGVEGHHMDLRAAINGCSTQWPIVLLAHNPKAAKKALELEQRVDLILSGHTHAGQMYVLVPIMYAMTPFFHGLYEYQPTGTYIYVSAGVFHMGAPMKMLGMSEIILITLKSSK